MKVCNVCKIEKELSEFNKHRRNKDGLSYSCRTCSSEEKKKYYKNNKETVKEKVSKYRENNLDIVNVRVKEYYKSNKESLLDYKKEYYQKNKEKNKERNKEYYQRNKKEINNKSKVYMKERRKRSPLVRLKEYLRSVIYHSIKNQGYRKNSRTEKILGCSFDEFKIYFEPKFIEGMSWENQGKWHIDHIRPVSWAKTEEEVYELNHYTNFQPLWQKDNLSKGNRWEG